MNESFKIIPVVAAIISGNEEYGKVLLVKRTSGDIETINRYEFPGGKVKNNETLENALCREIKEELNLDIIVDQVVYAQINEWGNEKYLVIFFECYSKLIIDEKKLPEHAWVTLQTIKKFNPLPGAVEALHAL